MVLLFTCTRRCLGLLTCSADQIPCILPTPTLIPTRSISIPTGRPRVPPFYPPPPARRRFEYVSPSPDTNTNANKPKPKPDHTRTKIERRPTNRHIPFDRVYVVDPETGKLSQTKHCLEELLQTVQAKQGQGRGRVIELVASTPEPIVRVTTRSEVEARYKEMKMALRKSAKVGEEPKEVQLTWGVAKADLEHKLRKARRDLDKGYRVAVVVAVKRGHRPSSRQELVAFGDEISQMLGEAGEEWKERELTERSMMLSFRKTDLGDGNS